MRDRRSRAGPARHADAADRGATLIGPRNHDPEGVRASRILVVAGATGTGKSALALDLAEAFAARGHRAEIVNGDAMQCYRGMDIGTAKVPPAARRGIPHHLLDVLDVDAEASVAWYQRAARGVIDRLLAEGATPILVGGSGLYLAAVCYGLDFPPHDDAVRRALEEEAARIGAGALHARLRALDPEAAARIDPRNLRRVVRALEAIELTGERFSAHLPGEEHPWRPQRWIVLEEERSALVRRLDARVRGMWEAGLVPEVARLVPAGIEHGPTAGRAIGYAQAIGQLRGRLEPSTAIADTQTLTRRYARRQVSWLRRYRHPVRLRSGVQDLVARALAVV